MWLAVVLHRTPYARADLKTLVRLDFSDNSHAVVSNQQCDNCHTIGSAGLCCATQGRVTANEPYAPL
jgi:hypothetical protein